MSFVKQSLFLKTLLAKDILKKTCNTLSPTTLYWGTAALYPVCVTMMVTQWAISNYHNDVAETIEQHKLSYNIQIMLRPLNKLSSDLHPVTSFVICVFILSQGKHYLNDKLRTWTYLWPVLWLLSSTLLLFHFLTLLYLTFAMKAIIIVTKFHACINSWKGIWNMIFY